MGVHLYKNGAWTDSGRIYRNSLNLFDKNTATVYDATISSTGAWTSGSGKTVRIAVTPSTTYTLHTNTIQSVFRLTELSSDSLPTINGNLIVRTADINSYTFTTSESGAYIVFQAGSDTVDQWIQELMLNIGSTALPYEPYNVVNWYTNNGYNYTSGAWS